MLELFQRVTECWRLYVTTLFIKCEKRFQLQLYKITTFDEWRHSETSARGSTYGSQRTPQHHNTTEDLLSLETRYSNNL